MSSCLDLATRPFFQCADRILQALIACGEAAWHSRLSEAYTRLFGHPLTGRLLEQHFGTRNISTIVWQHLRGRVLVECYIDENSFYLTTPAAAKRKIGGKGEFAIIEWFP